MNIKRKVILSSLLLLGIQSTATAAIEAIVVESVAQLGFFDNASEGGGFDGFEGDQIRETIGNRGLGYAGTFDTTTIINDETIFFKNGNTSFGDQTEGFSRTVIDITVENTESQTIRPTLASQIVPAGMGFYLSDCNADDLRTCQSTDDSPTNFSNFRSWLDNPFAFSTEFNFNVELVNPDTDEVLSSLYALRGGVSLAASASGTGFEVVTDFAEAAGILNNFRITSPLDSLTQFSVDWGATNFNVDFGIDLAVGERATVRYTTEVLTISQTNCGSDGESCGVAYGAFGDPIGRGGAAGRRPLSGDLGAIAARAVSTPLGASLSSSTGDQILGTTAGLYTFNPTFENGTLTMLASSGPGIATSVSAPTGLLLLLMGGGFLALFRKRKIS